MKKYVALSLGSAGFTSEAVGCDSVAYAALIIAFYAARGGL